jgi:oligoendopeptidase F
MEGINPKGEKYRAWVEHSHRHIQDAGQEEKIVKRGKKNLGRIKLAKIESDRLIKMNHQLNEKGKHKEAAQLNVYLYSAYLRTLPKTWT